MVVLLTFQKALVNLVCVTDILQATKGAKLCFNLQKHHWSYYKIYDCSKIKKKRNICLLIDFK